MKSYWANECFCYVTLECSCNLSPCTLKTSLYILHVYNQSLATSFKVKGVLCVTKTTHIYSLWGGGVLPLNVCCMDPTSKEDVTTINKAWRCIHVVLLRTEAVHM